MLSMTALFWQQWLGTNVINDCIVLAAMAPTVLAIDDSDVLIPPSQAAPTTESTAPGPGKVLPALVNTYPVTNTTTVR
jgi:hypothetical protein